MLPYNDYDNPKPKMTTRSFRILCAGLLMLATVSLCAEMSAAAPTNPPKASASPELSVEQQFQQWITSTLVTRSINLKDLGFKTSLELAGSQNHRDLFLPVPANIPILNASLQLNARYMRGHGGRTSVLFSIDDDPLEALNLESQQGDLSGKLLVDGEPRGSGFVRFSMDWFSIVSDVVCSNQQAPHNVLRIGSDTKFSYSYDRHAITSIASAWSALPQKPVLLIAGKTLEKNAYDSAWRIGVAIERTGKEVQIQKLPEVGDTVDLSDTVVPHSLMSIPAFAAIANATQNKDENQNVAHPQQYRINNLAELGALVVLGNAGPIHADILIADTSLLSALDKALDALGAQIPPGAAATYAKWKKVNLPAQAPVGQDKVLLGTLAGNPVIVTAPNVGQQASGLFNPQWRALAKGKELTVKTAQIPQKDAASILLSQFGNISAPIDVLTRGDRTVTIDLGPLDTESRLPSTLVLDVIASPDANDGMPAVVVYMNDILLGAENLKSYGDAQRIKIKIPRYALAVRNELRISFLRQPTQVRCHDTPTAYPAAILPTSHIQLTKVRLDHTFVGTAIALSGDTRLFVPTTWLNDAPDSLTRIVRVANATGLSPARARLQLLEPGSTPKVEEPFLAFDIIPKGISSAVTVKGDNLVLTTDTQKPLLDLSGLAATAVAEVAQSKVAPGIIYHNIGLSSPKLSNPFRLVRGNLAVLDNTGPIIVLDTTRADQGVLDNEDNPQTIFQRYTGWWVALAMLVILMLVIARFAQLRHRKSHSDPH